MVTADGKTIRKGMTVHTVNGDFVETHEVAEVQGTETVKFKRRAQGGYFGCKAGGCYAEYALAVQRAKAPDR